MYNPVYGGMWPRPGVNTFDGQGNNTRQTEILKTAALYANEPACSKPIPTTTAGA